MYTRYVSERPECRRSPSWRGLLWFVLIPSMFRRFDRLHAVPVRPKLFGGYDSSVPSDQTLAANGDRRAGVQQFCSQRGFLRADANDRAVFEQSSAQVALGSVEREPYDAFGLHVLRLAVAMPWPMLVPVAGTVVDNHRAIVGNECHRRDDVR
jgi:hypothetical protein